MSDNTENVKFVEDEIPKENSRIIDHLTISPIEMAGEPALLAELELDGLEMSDRLALSNFSLDIMQNRDLVLKGKRLKEYIKLKDETTRTN